MLSPRLDGTSPPTATASSTTLSIAAADWAEKADTPLVSLDVPFGINPDTGALLLALNGHELTPADARTHRLHPSHRLRTHPSDSHLVLRPAPRLPSLLFILYPHIRHAHCARRRRLLAQSLGACRRGRLRCRDVGCGECRRAEAGVASAARAGAPAMDSLFGRVCVRDAKCTSFATRELQARRTEGKDDH